MRNNDAVDITRRAEEWRSSGWTGYDPEAEPLTRDEIEREQTRYRSRRATMADVEGVPDAVGAQADEVARREAERRRTGM